MELIRTLALVLLLTSAIWFDGRQGRIPNLLVVFGLAAGLLIQFALAGLSGALTALEGIGVGLLVLGPLYALGYLGAGDVKLVAAVGSLMGPRDLSIAIVFIFLAGGVLSVAITLSRGKLRQLGRNLRLILFGAVIDLGLGQAPRATATIPTVGRMPYAVPIAVGVAAWFWWFHIRA
jgi:prepilin peptidase CpaA